MEWNTYRLRFEITGEKENEFHGETKKKKKKLNYRKEGKRTTKKQMTKQKRGI